MIPDQKPIWDRKHSQKDHEELRHKPSPLVRIAEPMFKRQSKILELGCGVGRDAVFLHRHGHDVVATDSSEIAIEQDLDHFGELNIKFIVLDIQDPLPYKPESFDVVYANLSLHYYSHQKTREIIEEIYRLLKPDGFLAFACKSVDDFHHGNGEEVEENIFVSAKGHVRHLFSKEYTVELLEGLFAVKYLDTVEELYSGEKSNILRCIAKKIIKNQTV